MKKHLTALIGVLFLMTAAYAGPGHDMAPYKGSAEFEQLKKLAGKWEGKDPHDKTGKAKIVVDYKVTSGGSALIETLGPGTPMEMVSIYSEAKPGKVSMTHYCM